MAEYVSPRTQAKRLEICRACPLLGQYQILKFFGLNDYPRCYVCGCFMEKVPGDMWPPKTALANQQCPIGKWKKVNTKP